MHLKLIFLGLFIFYCSYKGMAQVQSDRVNNAEEIVTPMARSSNVPVERQYIIKPNSSIESPLFKISPRQNTGFHSQNPRKNVDIPDNNMLKHEDKNPGHIRELESGEPEQE